MSALLSATDVSKSYGDRTVLAGLSLAVSPGHRIGVVGENGVGKSTFLRLLAGIEDADAGALVRPDDLGYLHQEPPFAPDATVGDALEDALADVRALAAELEAAAAGLGDPGDGGDPGTAPDDAASRYARALARAELAEVWQADARAAQTLAGLGLADVARSRLVAQLSGGERTRLGLAALLIRQPGALVLDEPTNHLDDDAADFLAAALQRIPGAVVLASHDRVFLEQVATAIFDLDPTPVHLAAEVASGPDGAAADVAAPGSRAALAQEAEGTGPTTTSAAGGTLYGGRYSDYLKAKAKERARWQTQYEAEQDELEQLRDAVGGTARNINHARDRRDNNKMGYDKRGDRVEQQVSRRVRNARLRLEQLEARQVPAPPTPLRFAPPASARAADGREGRLGERKPDRKRVVLAARDVVVPGRLDLAAAGVRELRLTAGARLLITGANGAGKSTLLGVLAGDLAAASGTVTRAPGTDLALLEQDVYLPGERRTPRQLLALMAGLEADSDAVDPAGLVHARDLDRPVGELSVGQRRRVILAMLVTHTPDVLLLDEPTNHISLTLAEELMAALREWPGAVVVASHDRWLRKTWTGQTVHLGRRS